MHKVSTYDDILDDVICSERVQPIVASVTTYIRAYLRKTKLFGYKFFEDDLITDVQLEIYYYESRCILQSKESDIGIGAYCVMAKQQAVNYSEACQTQKRRVNFEAYSLNGGECVDRSSPFTDSIELVVSIQQGLGQDIADLVQTVLTGGSLTAHERYQLKKYKSDIQRLLYA